MGISESFKKGEKKVTSRATSMHPWRHQIDPDRPAQTKFLAVSCSMITLYAGPEAERLTRAVQVSKVFHRKSKEDRDAAKSAQASDASTSTTRSSGGGGGDAGIAAGSAGGGVTPGKPMLNVEGPPPQPGGGKPKDLSGVKGVEAQPKTEGKGAPPVPESSGDTPNMQVKLRDCPRKPCS